jgi:hypothetical protein
MLRDQTEVEMSKRMVVWARLPNRTGQDYRLSITCIELRGETGRGHYTALQREAYRNYLDGDRFDARINLDTGMNDKL